MIETERLILRNYRESDFKAVHEYASLPDFSQFDTWGPNTAQDTRHFINECIRKSLARPRFQFELAVCLKDEETLIGGCAIRRDGVDSLVANLGYAMNPKYQSKGYATEATKALIEFGFSDLGLLVIYATCDTRNVASFRVMEKSGMKRVGIIERHLNIRGFLRDSFRYEIAKRP